MDQIEVDDFKKILQDHGYSSDDFSITETDQTNYDSNSISSLKIKVTVIHKSKNITRTYDSGNNTDWVSDFEKELQKGFFD